MERIKRVFAIQDGEGGLLGVLILLSFFFGAANNFIETSAFSLFLSAYPAQNLPYTYLIVAVVVSGLAYGYLRLGAQIPFSRLLIINVSFLAGLALLFQFGLLSMYQDKVKFILPLLFQIQVNFVNLAFWGLLGQIFTVQQAKRLFGLAGSGLWIGIIVTGFSMPLFVRWVGLTRLMWLASGSMLIALAVLLLVLRRYGAELTAQPQKKVPTSAETPRKRFLPGRYVTFIFGLVVIWWIVFFFVDVLYYDRVSAQFATQEEMAGFIGVYLALLGIFTWTINTFVSGWFFGRLGQRKALLLLPAMLTLSAALLFVLSNLPGAIGLLFFIMVGVKMFDVGIGFSLDRSALTILYQPLAAAERNRTQTMAEGIVQPIAIGLAGIMLIVLNTVLKLELRWMYLIFMGLAGIWLAVAWVLGREYIGMLFSAIDRRYFGKQAVDIVDRSLVDYLVGAVESPFPGTVLYALDTLAQIEYPDYPALLLRLTRHEETVIRLNVLERIEAAGESTALERVREMAAGQTDTAVQGQALVTLAKLGDDQDKQVIARNLASGDSILEQRAIEGLLRYCDGQAHQAARQRVIALAGSDKPYERRRAAEALAGVVDTAWQPLLLDLLADVEPEVQRAALATVRGTHLSPALFAPVLALSGKSGLAGPVFQALVRMGQHMPDQVKESFERALAEKDFRVATLLARVLGRIGLSDSVLPLKGVVLHPVMALSSAALDGLLRNGWQAETHDDRHLIEKLLEKERNAAAWSRSFALDHGSGEYESLLGRYLEQFARQCRGRSLSALACLYSKDVVSVITTLLENQEATETELAYALEFIEANFSGEHAKFLASLFEQNGARSPEKSGSDTGELSVDRLEEIYRHFRQVGRPLGQAIVVTIAGERLVGGAAGLVNEAAESGQDILREAGLLAIGRLEQGGLFEKGPDPGSGRPTNNLAAVQEAGRNMLSTMEKLLILKSVQLFESAPDDVLAEVAALLYEVEVPAGQMLFEKGELGDCMFIIVSGKMRVHDDDQVITVLGEHDSFGEIAMLDAKSRSTSISAEEDSLLLRLDQAPFYELMDDQIEIVKAVIQQLAGYVRMNVDEVERMHEMFRKMQTT